MTYSNPSKPLVSISITGNVEDPGPYNVEKGRKLGEALKMAGIKANSDLSRIDLETPVEGPRKYVIKALREKSGKRGNKH